MRQGKTIHLEAESGALNDVHVATDGVGFLGKGYVTGFTKDKSRLTLRFNTPQGGIYNLKLRYRSPSGSKVYEMSVNGSPLSGNFPQTDKNFVMQAGGKVELKAGANEIVIERGWGYFDIDSLDLTPVSSAMTLLKKPSKTPVNPKADTKTRALLGYLIENYGTRTLSGQHEIGDSSFITQATGKTPAIQGGDLIEYSPTRVQFGSKPAGMTERYIQSAKSGQILTLMWHWNAPSHLINKTYKNDQGKEIDGLWYRGFYTDATTFDLAKALENPHSEDYQLLLRDMDVIAGELKKTQQAGIPVLWRPLHEAEGGWFWWGAKGPDALKKLWVLLFERFTYHHNLNNLLWVYTSGAKADWYPGDAYVDIVGLDSYPKDLSDPLSADWEMLLARFNGKKLLALTEFGKVPDVERMYKFGVRWSYFMTWTGDLGPTKAPLELLKRVYTSPHILNKISIIKT